MMLRSPLHLARFAALPLAAFAVHQMRFLLAFGDDAGHELAATGHGYLDGVVPWLILVAATAVGGSVWRVLRATRNPALCSVWRTWATLTVGLVAFFTVQELVEGFVAAGHPPGLAGVFTEGYLYVVPAAMAVAGVLLLLRQGERSLVERLHRGRSQWVVRDAMVTLRFPRMPDIAVDATMSTAAAGRAPPRRALIAAA